MNCINHPDRERTAFCQNCGQPLCQECRRSIGAAVFCGPCLAARLNAAMPDAAPPAGGQFTYTGPASGSPIAGSYTYVDPASGIRVGGTMPPPPPRGSPSPWLAAALGFIPGVGAMYNEQYAKGVVHIAVFAILVGLSDSHDVFGMFVAGWIFYMAIEAYHTARARRDGLPLPNPFGLNDVGERLGFGKSWGSYPPPTPGAPYATTPGGAVPPPAPPVAPFTPGYMPPVPQAQPGWSTPPQPPYTGYYAPPMPPRSLDENLPHPGARFPVGALWLIALGGLFLLGNSGIFHSLWGFSSRSFLPIFMIGLAVWIFVRTMTGSGCGLGYSRGLNYGSGLGDDGSAAYRYRLVRALRSSVWIALVGVLFFLNDFDVLPWSHSWPLFLIVVGVLKFLDHTACSSSFVPPNPYAPPATPPVPPPAPAATASTPGGPDSDSRDINQPEGR